MKTLSIFTTYNCNLNCEYCLFSDRLNTYSIDLDLLKNKGILKQAKELGCETVSLTGGEPCLHPKFYKLIDLIIKNNMSFGIASNGFLYEKYIPLLKYKDNFKYITFSLDSHKEEIHDELRIKGSYKKVIEAIRFFSENGIDIKVSICLNKKNYKDLEEYIYFIETLGVRQIRCGGIIPTPRNTHLMLTDTQRKQCCQIINGLRNKVAVNLRIMSGLSTAPGRNFCSTLNLESITVTPKGELTFCCDLTDWEAVLGSLEKEKLSDLIARGKNTAEYLKDKRTLYLEYLKENEPKEGFNTCYFCKKSLKNVLVSMS